MRLADEKHAVVDEVKEMVTSSQFVDWLVFYEEKAAEELKGHDKADYYMAQVAWRIVQIAEILCDVPQSKRKDLKDMLLKFDGLPQEQGKKRVPVNPYKVKPGEVPGIEVGKTKLTPEQQMMVDRAKTAWIGGFGVPEVSGANGRHR